MARTTTIIMPGMCAGSVNAYAVMLMARNVIIDATQCALPLRHSHHRYTIDAPNGPINLTVPLTGDSQAMAVPLSQVMISNHGNWRHMHWGALFSSYGKSPFFDFIASELQQIIEHGQQTHLLELNMQLHELIVDFMDLPIHTTVAREAAHIEAALHDGACDLRRKMGGKKGDNVKLNAAPYYQMWTARHGGFTPALSVIDLLMNEGREGIFTLLKMIKNINLC